MRQQFSLKSIAQLETARNPKRALPMESCRSSIERICLSRLAVSATSALINLERWCFGGLRPQWSVVCYSHPQMLPACPHSCAFPHGTLAAGATSPCLVLTWISSHVWELFLGPPFLLEILKAVANPYVAWCITALRTYTCRLQFSLCVTQFTFSGEVASHPSTF